MTLAAIRDPAARIRAVGARRERHGDEAFALALGEIAGRAASGETGARDAMLACALWLLSPEGTATYRALLVRLASAPDRLESLLLEDDATEVVAHKRVSRHARLLDPGGTTRVDRDRRVWVPPCVYRSPGRTPFFSLEVARAVLGAAFTPSLELAWTEASDAWDAERAHHPADETVVEGHWEVWRRPRWETEVALGRLAARPTVEATRALLRQRPSSVPQPVLKRAVIAVAARRPTTRGIVHEVLASPWVQHLEVRSAIVENPFTPLRVALLLAPTAPLRAIAEDQSDVHPRLRLLARRLSPLTPRRP